MTLKYGWTAFFSLLLPASREFIRPALTLDLSAGKCNSTARSVEERSPKIDTIPREQFLMHFVPPDQLHDMWAIYSGDRGISRPAAVQRCHHFAPCQGPQKFDQELYLGRNDDTVSEILVSIADERYSSADFYYDIGKETCPSQTKDHGDLFLCKKPCLDSYYAWFRNGGKFDLCKKTQYTTTYLETPYL